MEGHGRSTIIGIAWLSFGRGINVIVNFGTIAVLSRILTPGDFGVVAIPLAIVMLGTMLASGTFGMHLVQRPSIGPSDVGAALLLSLGLGLSMAALVAAGAPSVERMIRISDVAPLLALAGVILPVSSVAAVGSNLLQREKRFGSVARTRTAANLGYGAAAIALAVYGFGPVALVLGAIARAVIEAAMMLAMSLRIHPPAFTRAGFREAWNSAGGYTLWSLFLWGGNNIDRIIVARMFGPWDLGLYVRAMGVLQIVNSLIGTGAFRVLFSTFSRIQDDLPRLRSAVVRVMSTGLIVSALASGFLVVYADLLVRIVLGPQWLKAIPIIQIMFLSLIARSGFGLAEAIPASMGLVAANSVRQFARMVLVGFGAWIGGYYGVVGAAAGVAAAFWLFYLGSLVFIMRLIRMPVATVFRINALAILVAAVPALAAMAIRESSLGPSWVVDLASLAAFGLLALAILLASPAQVIGEDAVRLRAKLQGYVKERARRS